VQNPELLARLPEIRAQLEAIDLDAPQGCELRGRGFGRGGSGQGDLGGGHGGAGSSGQGGRPGARQPNVCEQLNSVRRALVEDFAVYAGGRPFFGPKIENTIAPAGEYRVVLTVGETTVEGKITVRDDPLVRRSGER
jgi:hypothetical protein